MKKPIHLVLADILTPSALEWEIFPGAHAIAQNIIDQRNRLTQADETLKQGLPSTPPPGAVEQLAAQPLAAEGLTEELFVQQDCAKFVLQLAGLDHTDIATDHFEISDTAKELARRLNACKATTNGDT